MSTSAQTIMEPIILLTKDLKKAAVTLSRTEARYLVDYYYSMQKLRIACGLQTDALEKTQEPHSVINWLGDNSGRLEQNVKNALKAYAVSNPVGAWSMSIVGIGPVLAAGLLAHIDITKAPTVGHIWSFAGIIGPSQTWEKGQKRPWNATLKTLCWKIGESFTKFSGHKDDVYGKIYLQRKALEESRNAQGLFADQAKASLAAKKYGKDTDAYKAYAQGRLPQARIHLRAQRYAVKMFLSHWHWVAYESYYKQRPPKPFVVEHLGHVDILTPPNWTPIAEVKA